MSDDLNEHGICPKCHKAAGDEIERLTARFEKLEGALQNIIVDALAALYSEPNKRDTSKDYAEIARKNRRKTLEELRSSKHT